MRLTDSWNNYLAEEFSKEYMLSLQQFLALERTSKVIFPIEQECFSALNMTPFEQVKVVILGQDPYHGEGQAHGLSFSVKPEVKIPPSLVNIYKELEADLAIPSANHGYLKQWAEQGVLLLNSILTVEESKPGSHQNKGWEIFTDRVIEVVNQKHTNVVFMLWGSYAQKKGKSIDRDRHCVLESVHPSPLSAYRGFLGCRHFSKANDYLLSSGKQTIDWALGSVEHSPVSNQQIGFTF